MSKKLTVGAALAAFLLTAANSALPQSFEELNTQWENEVDLQQLLPQASFGQLANLLDQLRIICPTCAVVTNGTGGAPVQLPPICELDSAWDARLGQCRKYCD